ncbi:cytochrome P450 [Roseicella aerolata]|uniref:Cytochrome P450 n=1 Tax=Roseicella aerolata TaxID=2883479 RepID=A0A9X1LBL0_9PROT|nr:cytochrome P450 [Roseicella aerolata]MCB4823300.1 cytochrome P450 [Roseicella aerolata]
MSAGTYSMGDRIPVASIADTTAALAEVVLPTFAKGVIIRRPKVMRLAERMDLDRRAVRRMQKLRETYGDGPLMLRLPLRNQALILSPGDVQRVLEGTPHPFSPASAEKTAALAHLEPKASLISEGPERTERRRFNEEVLDSRRDVHRMAGHFMEVVGQEAAGMLEAARAQKELSWDEFFTGWYRIVRRVVLGDAARDDYELTDMLAKLRAAGNWAFLHPGHKGRLERFHRRVDEHLRRAEPGTLAAVIAATPHTPETAPSHQVAHWFFAFDPGGMSTFRGLALLLAHPEQEARARREIAEAGPGGRANLPFLRAAILEALRLWPTTPVILRETREETLWRGGAMPKDTSVLIFAPFFHRDDANLPHADTFHPDLWLDGPRQGGWPLVPFSGGPGICPARNLVPMLGSATIAALLASGRLALKDPSRLDASRPMPALLDNYTLAFVPHS